VIRTLAACGVILALLLGGIYVNSLYQTFRRRHPELGPFRRLGGGCACGSGHCSTRE